MTISTNEQTLITLTIKASDALDLFTGGSVCIDAKNSPLNLAALYLSVKDNKLVAASSDRYRLIEGSLPVEGVADFEPIGLMVNDVKRVITTLKDLKSAIKLHDMTLTIAGDMVSVAVNGVSLTLNANGAKFPPYEQLFTGVVVPASSISFNPQFMADFGKVPNNLGDKKAQLIAEFTGEGKPIALKIPHDRIAWRALLMPMRAGK